MKLATLKNGSRDGVLIVVNRALTKAVRADGIASTMQQALDSWSECESRLKELYDALNTGNVSASFDLDSRQLMAPLPRAYQWADGSAYVKHVELVRKARGAELPETFWTDPLMYQGGSDAFVGPNDPILVADVAYGIDYEGEVAVVTDDVPMGIGEEAARSHIKLIMIVNDVSLRNLIPSELAKGFGFFHAKPATAFSPVAVTPDELGDSWDGGKVNLPLWSYINGVQLGNPNAGVDMTFDFPRLIQHAAKTRFLTAGTIIGSGTVSNGDRQHGVSCLAEKRMLEVIDEGSATTEFMKFGDTVKIEMLDSSGQNIFGTIEQEVKRYDG